MIAHNAYDGKVNLWWNAAKKIDFGRYNIYVNKTDITDVTGLEPIQQISDIVGCTCQISGLENGTKYYFAISVEGETGNENTQVTSVNATPTAIPTGTKDPDLVVDIYNSEKAWAGTTLLADSHNIKNPRIIEVNMLGEIIWQYLVPQNMIRASDVELLPNNNILFIANGGVYEIDRSGQIIWQYLTDKIDHDADRLPNGNTIFVFGMSDKKSDAQVTEINTKGEIVWQWKARDYFDMPPYNSISEKGSWVHTNAVTRLANGNTLISLRNFDIVVEVDPKGEVIRTIGEGIYNHMHDPEILPNGNILAANHGSPNRAIELDPNSNKIVWEYTIAFDKDWPIRDVNRLPNGNTLITGILEIMEVTPEGEVVWRLKQQGVQFTEQNYQDLGFYKAERINP